MSLENLDKIYYINLDYRVDRRESIEKFLHSLNLPEGKCQRISAHHTPTQGALGCAMSHLDALNDAKEKGYQRILILEDDFVCPDLSLFNSQFEKFFSQNIEWDLVMISANIIKSEPSEYENLVKIINAQTTSGYMIQNHFYDKVIFTFENAVEGLSKGNHISVSAIDVTWKTLQPESNWYCFNPKVGYQMDGFSDIEKRNVNYRC